ncbi:HAD family hydrolase [Saccharibacillus sp. CPCC 101409]|uniref:HAD family hydrolase n=1 Tax=Saccharibacillus sp. CPCC 101409 TaxID=3058041 RepID=UPI0026730CD6|nr:HAD family hydrolase [Saccharibacillus sp. CPCC 101409]MDO3411714.1 HAD family hydrolase [Saccharibacillus sp. CPCC 101409]
MKCIIFDLDGTLGNTLPLCIAAFKKAIEPLAGRSLSDREIVATFGPSEEGTVQALIPQHYDRGIEDYLLHYRELHGMCGAPFEGMRELLDRLREQNVRLALVTGKGERSTAITLELFGLDGYFEAVETGSPRGPRKTEGIRAVLERLGLTPAECIYVGDAPSDIEASRAAGVPVISAAWAETAEPELLRPLEPDELFVTVAEFERYLERSIG